MASMVRSHPHEIPFRAALALATLIAGCGTNEGGSGGTGGTATTTTSAAGGDGGAGGTGGTSSGGSGGTGMSSCALPNYPDASCTGVPAGTTLTEMDGDLTIETDGQVIEGMDIHGCVSINAPGVIIRKSKITCASFLAVASYAGSFTGAAALLEDVEISCDNQAGTAVGDYNVTVRRANIHSCENGFDVDGMITVEDSFIHDLIPYDPVTDPHVDGLQITPVGKDVTIKHNTIYAGIDGNAAIISPKLSDGQVTNITIEQNLMAGGGYTLYCQQAGSGDNYRVVDNHFSTLFHPTVGEYAPWTDCEDETEVTGNVYHETGEPVPF